MEPAVAMEAGVQKEAVAVDFQGGEVEVASCPLVEEVDPWGVHVVLDHGPLVVEEVASTEEAFH